MSRLASLDAIRRSAFALLLIALVLVQTLGLMHRVVHLHGRVQQNEAPAASVGGSSDSWVKALFEGHDSERDCAQYDQLSHGDAAWGSTAPTCCAAAALPVAVHHPGWHLAAQAAGFLARGPPAQV